MKIPYRPLRALLFLLPGETAHELTLGSLEFATFLGGTGDDDFCWEIIDVQPALTPADYNAFGMGMDQRIPPL